MAERPKVFTHARSVRLTAYQAAALRWLADAEGFDVTDVIRSAIDDTIVGRVPQRVREDLESQVTPTHGTSP